MKKLIILIITLISLGCGKSPFNYGEFTTYVEKFDQYAREQNVILDYSILRIEFSDTLPAHFWGVCKRSLFSPAIVLINSNTWKTQSEEHREALLLHELGHCLLNRRHNDTKISGTWMSLSIMQTYLISAEEYRLLKSQYIEELFHPERFSDNY